MSLERRQEAAARGRPIAIWKTSPLIDSHCRGTLPVGHRKSLASAFAFRCGSFCSSGWYIYEAYNSWAFRVSGSYGFGELVSRLLLKCELGEFGVCGDYCTVREAE